MLAKYTGIIEQGKEEVIEKTANLPLTIGGLKRYAHKLKPVKIGGGMTWTNINLRYDVPILKILEYAKDNFREEDFEVYIQPVQHSNVKVIGWLLALHGDSETNFRQKVLEDKLLKKTI